MQPQWIPRTKAYGYVAFLPPAGKYPELPEPPEVEDCAEFGGPQIFKKADVYFLDGSGGKRSGDERLRRCGWAAITADFSDSEAPEVTSGYFGPLPGPSQTVPRSELYAAVAALENRGGVR